MPARKTKSTAKAKTSAKAKAKAKATAKAREEKRAQERAAQIKSGALIEGRGSVEFHRVENGTPGEVEKRAAGVLKALESSKTPVAGKDLQKRLGGGWPQYLSIFATLKAQGLVTEYRQRTGSRGGTGVAYMLTK